MLVFVKPVICGFKDLLEISATCFEFRSRDLLGPSSPFHMRAARLRARRRYLGVYRPLEESRSKTRAH